jgi:hypothetical protein
MKRGVDLSVFVAPLCILLTAKLLLALADTVILGTILYCLTALIACSDLWLTVFLSHPEALVMQPHVLPLPTALML